MATSAAKVMAGAFRRSMTERHVMRLRSGMGMPIGTSPPPTSPLAEDDELTWDDGSPNPEPCVDNYAPHIGKYEALAWVSGGLGFFAFVGLLAKWNDKASRIPWAPREYPFDNLRVELGGDPNV